MYESSHCSGIWNEINKSRFSQNVLSSRLEEKGMQSRNNTMVDNIIE